MSALVALSALVAMPLAGRAQAAASKTATPAHAADQLMLLEVQINGRAVGKVGEFTLHNGALLSQRKELRELGFRVLAAGDAGEEELVPLSNLPGLTWRVDEANQMLYVVAGDDCLLSNVMEVSDRPRITAKVESGTGMTLNYDLVNTFTGHQNGTSGAVDLRAFSPLGTASSGFLAFAGAGGTGGGKNLVRLDTGYTFADPATLRRYSVGDFISGGLGWTRPVRLEGVQVRTDFNTRPDLVTFPLPSVSGSAGVPSTVDVLANGNLVLSQQTNPGPFEIPQLPVVTGAGTITMTLTNSLGQQVTVNTPFYASSSLLTPGLETFSVQAGAVRRSWGSVSNDFGDIAASGTYRRGITRTLTLEASGEGTPGALMTGGGATVNVHNLFVLNAAVAGSMGGGRPGAQVTLGGQRIARRLSLSGSATLASNGYRDIAALNGDPVARRQVNGNLGISAGHRGSLGIAYAGVDLVDAPVAVPGGLGSGLGLGVQQQHSHVVSASYSLQVHGMSVAATDFLDLSHSGSSGVMVGVTIPFGHRSSVSVSFDSQGGYAQLEAQKGVTTIGDWGYQAYLSAGGSSHEFAQVQYKSPSGLLSAGVSRSGGASSLVLESLGAISLVDGGLFPSNTVNDSFAVVDTSGLEHVRVLQENRSVGSTNSHGRLLVTDLRSFDVNHIGIEPTDVPMDTTLTLTSREVRPQDRSGVVLRFPVKVSHAALLRLVDEAGKAVSVGSTATLKGTGVVVPVGFDGEAYVQDLQAHNEIAVERADGMRCEVVFDYSAVPGEIPTIGPLACHERKQ